MVGTGGILNTHVPSPPLAESSWVKLSQVESSWVKLSHVESSWVKLSQVESSWVKLSQPLDLPRSTAHVLHGLWCQRPARGDWGDPWCSLQVAHIQFPRQLRQTSSAVLRPMNFLLRCGEDFEWYWWLRVLDYKMVLSISFENLYIFQKAYRALRPRRGKVSSSK